MHLVSNPQSSLLTKVDMMGYFFGLLLVSYLGLHLSKRREVPPHWPLSIQTVSGITWVSAKTRGKNKATKILSGSAAGRHDMFYIIYTLYTYFLLHPTARIDSTSQYHYYRCAPGHSHHIPHPSPALNCGVA